MEEPKGDSRDCGARPPVVHCPITPEWRLGRLQRNPLPLGELQMGGFIGNPCQSAESRGTWSVPALAPFPSRGQLAGPSENLGPCGTLIRGDAPEKDHRSCKIKLFSSPGPMEGSALPSPGRFCSAGRA